MNNRQNSGVNSGNNLKGYSLSKSQLSLNLQMTPNMKNTPSQT